MFTDTVVYTARVPVFMAVHTAVYTARVLVCAGRLHGPYSWLLGTLSVFTARKRGPSLQAALRPVITGGVYRA